MKKRLLLIFSIIIMISIGLFFSYKGLVENSFTSDITNKSNAESTDINKKKIELSSIDATVELIKEDKDQAKVNEEDTSESHIDLDTAFNHPIILDTHNDTMMNVVDEVTWLAKVDISKETSFDIDLPKLQKGGLNIPFFAAYTEGYYENTPRSISRTLALINALYYTESNNKESFEIARSLKDIVNIINEGRVAAVPTIEGAYSLDNDKSLELLNQYNDLGIRAIGLTWNYSNKLGEGAKRIYGDSKKTPSSGGLTELGEQVVREMNRLGIIVDVSHMAESTFWDVIKISNSPVIASHSAVASIKAHNRNLNDKQLKALSENGGVISIVFYPAFLKDGDVYIKDMVDHIDYVVNLIGIDHVGIGSDFDGARMPKDLKDSSEIYKVRQELTKRNYNESQIEKIMGKNILRVLKEVENNAEKANNLSDIKILANFNMGDRLDKNTPLLIARIEGDKDIEKTSIIVDGIRYPAIYNKTNSSISLQIKDPLKEKFHIATFEVETADGRIKRESKIFYVD